MEVLDAAHNQKHEDHPDPLFPKCVHGEIDKRKRIKVGKPEMKLI